MDFLIKPSSLSGGAIGVPGDKSISHRALMFGAIADGRSTIDGFLNGEDCLSTMAALRAMGVDIESPGPTSVVISGVGLNGLKSPDDVLDMGNSGTAMRLFAGLLSGQAFDSILVGDQSLSSRPMGRVITPLTLMQAKIESQGGKPPLKIVGSSTLTAIDYELPVASAQVKSAVLLAGLYANGMTRVKQPAVTRDHTERMLRAMGVDVGFDAGWITLQGGQSLTGGHIEVPADLSSAAFPLVAAIVSENASITVSSVGVNPTRTGVLEILRAMGANLTLSNERNLGGEPVADITASASTLRGTDVDPALVSLAIDEFPLLFVAAALARGTTRFSGLSELRVKESDRIGAMAQGLTSLGIVVTETPDGAEITGGDLGEGTVQSFGDHRIAMAFAVAATCAAGQVTIRETDAVNTSFPGFVECLRGCGADLVAVKGLGND